jgi:GSH-dependent disulfide-bond oxidoreductase
MKLYGSSNGKSFNSLKLRLALAEASAPYEYVPIDLAKKQQFDAEFVKLNPHAKIPVLVDGDFVLPESDAILWYLGEKYPDAKLLPVSGGSDATRQARARILQWCDFASTTLYYAYSQYWTYALGDDSGRNPVLAEAALGKVARGVSVMEVVLAAREWIAGQTVSIADLSNAAIVFALKRRLRSDPLAANPRVAAWYERVTARPSWKSATRDEPRRLE